MPNLFEFSLNELDISSEELEVICNIDNLKDQYEKTYQYIRRSSKPIGVLYNNSLSLKLYHMLREKEPLPQNLVENLESFLVSEINAGKIKTDQGVGFAILSQGFLSVNLWGRGNVLFTQTYTIESNYPELTRVPLEKTGVACTWEAKIMYHEYELWHKYLESNMRKSDKLNYLTKFISGDL